MTGVSVPLRPSSLALGLFTLAAQAQAPAPMAPLSASWQAQWALRLRTSEGGTLAPVQPWRVATGQTEIPAAFDGTRLVVVQANPKQVQALDPATGKALWGVPFTGLLAAPPQIAGAYVVFALEGGRVVVLDAATGALRHLLSMPAWKSAKGASTPAKPHLLFPAVSGTTLVVGWSAPTLEARPEQGITAFDLATGALRWSASAPLTSELHPLILGDRVVVGGGGQLAALDLQTGQVAWGSRLPKRVTFESCQLIEDRLFLRTAQELIALDPVTGRMLWSQEVAGTSLLVGAGDRLVFLAPRGAFNPTLWLVAFNARTGEKAWEWEAEDARLPWIRNGRVYVNIKEEVMGLDIATGFPVWRKELGGPLMLPLLLQGDALLAVHKAKGGARVLAFRLTDGAETGALQTREKLGPGLAYGGPKGLLLPLAEGGVATLP